MAEKYLEQAVVTLASAFSENGDALTSSIPDLSGTLTGLGMHMAALNSSLKLIVERQRSQEENANSMRQRIVDLETSCAEAHLRLELLTNSRDGVVSWSALNPLLEELAKRSEVRQVEERCNAIEQKQTGCVTRSEIQPFRSNVSQQLDALEKRSGTLEEKHSTFSKSASRKIDELRAATEDLHQSHTTFQIATENAHTRIRDALTTGDALLSDQIKQLESSASDNLGQSVEEIVKCLSKHSQAIEDINNRESRWQENTANVKEVHALRKEMISLKREMEASSYKVHEAYSKCLSIATLAGAGGRNREPEFSTLRGYEEGAASPSSINTLVQGNQIANTKGMVATLEEQIETLRLELADVQSSKLGAISNSIRHIRATVERATAGSKKTDALLRNILFVFSEGKPERFEKFIQALEPLREPVVLKKPLDLTNINTSAIPQEQNDTFLFDKIHLETQGTHLAPPLGDFSLAVSYLDQFIRSSVRPVLDELVYTLTRKQMSFVNEDALEAETKKRMAALVETSLASPHRVAEFAPSDRDESGMLRLGVEIADAFSPEERFSSLTVSQGRDATKAAPRGVDVISVEQDGIAHKFGLVAGDRILAVGGVEIENAENFVSCFQDTVLSLQRKGAPVLVDFLIQCGDRKRKVTFDLSFQPIPPA